MAAIDVSQVLLYAFGAAALVVLVGGIVGVVVVAIAALFEGGEFREGVVFYGGIAAVGALVYWLFQAGVLKW